MANLTSLTLPMGTSSKPKTLIQKQIDTLISVYYDTKITDKKVSGYVFKSTIKKREYYLLTQLGLHVSYNTLQADSWSLTSNVLLLHSGESATLTIGGGLLLKEVNLSIDSVIMGYGTVSADVVKTCFTIVGNTVRFNKGSVSQDFTATVRIKGVPIWDSTNAKTVNIDSISVDSIPKTYINNGTGSSTLIQEGNKAIIEDYISKCKCYVFNAAGTKKAEIASATFEGTYAAGMTSGTVTFKDGTTKNIGELNAAGCNFMVLRPALHVFSGLDNNGNEVLQNTGAYSLLQGEKVFPKKYIGMFKAFNSGGILKSQPNRNPTGAQTIAVFQAQAKAGGQNYGLWNYTDWCKENALHLSYFGNTNYEKNVGVGRINNYNDVRNIVTGFTMPHVGKNICGIRATTDSQGRAVNCLNFFGIEGLGEQIWEFVIGFRHDGSTAYIWDDNDWAEAHTPDRTFKLGVTSANGSYISMVIAGHHFDMMPNSVGASATTGYCDGHWVSTSGRLLFVGGNAGSGSLCGLSASDATYGFSSSNALLGARLAFYGEPTEVTGAKLLD